MSHAPIRTPWDDAPAEGEMIEVAEGVLWGRLPLPMKLDHVNIYAIDEGADGWAIIDTGFASNRGRKIWQTLIDGPLGGRPISRIICTHHHPDHIGLAGWLQDKYDAPIYMSRTAWLLGRMLTLDEQKTHSDEAISFYKSAGMDADVFAEKMGERPFNFCDVVAPMSPSYTQIHDQSIIKIGGRDWRVRFGQGHAPDQVTLWSESDNLVIGADQLLATISPNLGVYPTEPEADPVGEWLDSCDKLAAHARDDQLVLPGHKLPFTGLPARMVQLIENHHSALRRLEEFLVEPHVGGDCFIPIFKREIRGSQYGLALAETVAHLNHLHQTGRISRTEHCDGAWRWQKC